MDPQLLNHYHGPQRDPVFGRATPQPAAPRSGLSFTALVIYAALCGFAIGGCVAVLLHHLP